MTELLTDYALNERLPDWGVLVLESHHSPQFTMDWRTHGFVKVVYVLSGQGSFCFSDNVAPFIPGDVIVVPPQTENRIEDAPGAASSLYVCCLDTTLFHFDQGLTDRFQQRRFRGDGHFAHRVASVMRRMVHAQARGGQDCALTMISDALQLTQQILAAQSRTSPIVSETTQQHAEESGQMLVSQYVDALQTDFFEATTIDDAAESLGMSRRMFTKQFAEITGKTWLTYVRNLAIEHAKRQLCNTSLPIVSVAFECGFNDLSTFYRQFKRQVGKSPAAYRRESVLIVDASNGG